MRRAALLIATLALTCPASAWSQEIPAGSGASAVPKEDQDKDRETMSDSLGAKSAAAKIGARKTNAEVGVNPLNRQESRIMNRVESRIRNRIDRYYDPLANAESPFVVANEKTLRQGSKKR